MLSTKDNQAIEPRRFGSLRIQGDKVMFAGFRVERMDVRFRNHVLVRSDIYSKDIRLGSVALRPSDHSEVAAVLSGVDLAKCDLCDAPRSVENLCADCAYWADGNLTSNQIN